MPDLGLPRVLARGERGSARREPLAGASFGTLFLGWGARTRRIADAPARMQAGFCPVRFARDMLSACRALFVCDRFAGCDSGLQLVAHDQVDELLARVYVELRVDMLRMRGGRVAADDERVADIRDGAPMRQKPEHLGFARRQLMLASQQRHPLPDEVHRLGVLQERIGRGRGSTSGSRCTHARFASRAFAFPTCIPDTLGT